MNCTCGHVEDEHLSRGDDKEFPGSVRCDIDDCPCEGFEWDGEDDDE